MHPQPPARLIAANNMRTMQQWNDLDHTAKVALLAALTPAEIRAQASVLAVAGERSIESVLNGWRVLGYAPEDRIAAAKAARV